MTNDSNSATKSDSEEEARRTPLGSFIGGFLWGLILGLLLVFVEDVGESALAKFGLVVITTICLAIGSLIFRIIFLNLANGGRKLEGSLYLSGAICLLFWDQPWAKWLIIPVVFLVLIGSLWDYSAHIKLLKAALVTARAQRVTFNQADPRVVNSVRYEPRR